MKLVGLGDTLTIGGFKGEVTKISKNGLTITGSNGKIKVFSLSEVEKVFS